MAVPAYATDLNDIILCGHWEQSWLAPVTEAPMWAWPIRDFGGSDWRMWPISGIECPDQAVTLTEYRDVQAMLVDLPDDHVRVFVEPDRKVFPIDSPTPLSDFDHPAKAAYIFGSAHFNPTIANRRADDPCIVLPTVANAGVLWPTQVAVALLHDRLVKSWQ